MKKIKTVVLTMFFCFVVLSNFNFVYGAQNNEKSVLHNNIENFYSAWENTAFEYTDITFAQFMFKEIFGHDYNKGSDIKSYPINSINKIRLNAKKGDLIVLKKGNDTYDCIIKDCDKTGMDVYEVYWNINKFTVSEKRYSYDNNNDKNKTSSFMDGRFNGGTYTVYHSNTYDQLNHIHQFNKDMYCNCGSYNGAEVITVDIDMYILKSNTKSYELPHSGSNYLYRLNISQFSEKVTAVTLNGNDEIWCKTIYGWINSNALSFENTYSISKLKTFDSVTGIVINIDKLPVRSLNNTSYTPFAYIKEGEIVTITKPLNSWYQIDYDGKRGYVESKFIKLLK